MDAHSPSGILDSLEALPKRTDGFELIQQWQYMGKAHPKMLADEAFECSKRAGLTSVQSYVYWAEIEPQPDTIDFSTYDVLLEKLERHKLKWVPFFILGPYYATPAWFQQTVLSTYAECLEHGKQTKIQSIWNPCLRGYVDRFLRLTGEHYRDSGILESITLGIGGNWGESLYPAGGGFLQEQVGFHTHLGWWCGDRHAISNFRKFLRQKYKSLRQLNAAWATNFGSFEQIGLPSLRQKPLLLLIQQYLRRLPTWAKCRLKTMWSYFLDVRQRPLSRLKGAKAGAAEQQRWIDFVDWYLSSMTSWAEFWVRTARRYFPDTEIYLTTGGNGHPALGADFSAQTKMVSRYKAGIRITNQTDDYDESFILTRLVSTASRFYKAYFVTEAGGVNQPRGVTMRVFDAATSGAKGIYFKSIIGLGADICTGNNFPHGEPTAGAVNLVENLHYLALSEPLIDVAVLLANTSVALDRAVLASVYKQCSKLRDVLDFDLIDENLIADGVLNKYRFLLLLDGRFVRRQTLIKLEDWITAGGIVIAAPDKRLSAIGDDTLARHLFSPSDNISRIGEGYVFRYHGKGKNHYEFIKRAVYNIQKVYPWPGIAEIDDECDGIYATRFAEGILYFNSNDTEIEKSVEIHNLPQKLKFKVTIKPYSIVFKNLTDPDIPNVSPNKLAGITAVEFEMMDKQRLFGRRIAARMRAN